MSQVRSALFVYVTVGDVAEAQRLGRAAVERRLAACANIIAPMQSIYRWQGTIEQSNEVVVVFKTTEVRWPALKACLTELHPYDCPCIVALPVADGHHPFLDWIGSETSGGPCSPES